MDQASKLRQLMGNEDNRQLTDIEYGNSNAKVIVVTSGKGGVGKTSFSVNAAMEFARKGKKVVVFDADFGLANVEVMLGIRPKYNLLDLIHNNMSMEDIITQGPENIGFISGGSGVSELATLDNDSIKLLISKLVQLDKMYDIVIIDTGAGITDSVMEFVLVGPEIVLVVTPEPTSITDSYSLLKVLRRKDKFDPLYKTINVVVNRASGEEEGIEVYNKINTVSSKFLNIDLKYMGFVPQDKNAAYAVIEQKPVVSAYPMSPASKAIAEIANKLFYDDRGECEKKEGIARVFLNFIKSKRKKI